VNVEVITEKGEIKMKRIIIKYLAVFLILSVLIFPNKALGKEKVGYCEMTITKEVVGYDNGVTPNNYCEQVIVGYYEGGNYHISGTTTAVVEYSGQKFRVSNPFSPNSYEILTVYTVDGIGNGVGTYNRLSGQTRLDTAIEVSKKGWPNRLNSTEKSVILARADNPADALAASSLSGVKEAPILLTYSTKIDQSVLDELNRLNAQKIYILGGQAAIQSEVENKLVDLDYSVERVHGATRFETAARINEVAGTSTSTKAIIANGYTVADALSASADAAINGVPIYLSNKNQLPVNLPSSVSSVDIYGGTAVISDVLETQLESKGITVHRISGKNRYATSVAGAMNLNETDSNIILVRGESTSSTKQDFPDAVAASALAKRMNAEILLVHPTRDIAAIKTYLQGKNLDAYVLGGEAAISTQVLKNLGLRAAN
jgi:putative cell wall-binding protein